MGGEGGLEGRAVVGRQSLWGERRGWKGGLWEGGRACGERGRVGREGCGREAEPVGGEGGLEGRAVGGRQSLWGERGG